MIKISMKRLDAILLEWGVAPSKSKSQELIRQGCISVFKGNMWSVITQPGKRFAELKPEHIRLEDKGVLQFVARSGHKLAGALDYLQLDVVGWRVLDIGISTGGFTDCLLQRGAEQVVGVDVGRDQLALKVSQDPRVVHYDGINAKSLLSESAMAPYRHYFDLIVMDVSFISVQLIFSQLGEFLKTDGRLLSLIKPQFELGASALNKKGIVKDSGLYDDLKLKICNDVRAKGFEVSDYFLSSLRGQDGNQEFFLYAKKQ